MDSAESDVDYLEELESRLYSQVFHSTSENEELSDISKLTEVNCEVPLQSVKHYRYFMIPNISKDMPTNPSTFIPFLNHEPSVECKEKSDNQFLQNNISITPTSTTVVTDSNCDNMVQNNITVNQFTVPLIIQSDYPNNGQVLNPYGQYINSWPNNFSIRRKRNRLKRRGKKQALSNSTVGPSSTIADVHTSKPIVTTDEVIILSDESSNECVLVEAIVQKNKVNSANAENGGSKNPESDDDIIYISPPPPEIINIDIEESEESVNITTLNNMRSNLSTISNLNHKEQNILNPIETSASNDFLDTAIVDSSIKFNFGLHGVDFNSPSDFVRPHNPVPVESCETESSCSTNEHSRDFNNTVKTIVFDEVEFPKEDIFSEKNLESFKTFITPQRSSKLKTDLIEKVADTLSSDSSIDSDYDDPEMRNLNIQNMELNKMLPILSPMVSENEHVLNKKNYQKRMTQSGKCSSKRKSDEMDVSMSNRQFIKKKLKKLDKALELIKSTEVSDYEKTKKKKRTSEKEKDPLVDSIPNTETMLELKSNKEETTVLFETSEETVISKSKKKKGKSELISTPVDNKEKSKKKKKKRYVLDYANHIEPVVNASADENENVQLENEIEAPQLNNGRTKEVLSMSEQNNLETIDIEDFVIVDSLDNDLSGVISVGEDSANDVDKLVLDYEYDLNLEVTLDSTKSTTVSVDEKPKKKKNFSEKEEVSLFVSTPKRKSLSESKSNTEESRELFETSEQTLGCRSNRRKEKNESSSTSKIKKMKKKKRNTVESTPELEYSLNTSVEYTENVVEIPIVEVQLDDEISKEASSTWEHNNTKSVIIQDVKVIDSIHNNLSELITIDEASVTDDEIVDLENEKESNRAVVTNDLQLANCISISQPLINGTVTSNDLSNTEIQCSRHQRFDKPFNMDDILRSQSDNPEKWQVSLRDRASYLYTSKERGPRCNRCRRFGHTAIRCTEKPDEPACILCGTRGHQESRCTVKMCNQCGRHGDYNVRYCRSCFEVRETECRLCRMPGHLEKNCPDLWRRYHLTITEGPIVVAEGSRLKPRDQLWCCGCARRGHLEHECCYYRREYPPTTPDILSYQDVYSPIDNVPKPVDAIVTASSSRELPPTPPPPTINSQANCSDSMAVYPGPSMQQSSQSLPSFIPLNLEGSSREEMPKRVLNPYYLQNDHKDDVLDKMKLNFGNNTVSPEVREWERLHDSNSIRNIIMTMPQPYLIDYIGRNMHELETTVSKYDPKELKQIFFMCEYGDTKNLSKQHIKQYHITKYRKLNMFIFGVHGFRDGRLHINYLRKFLSNRSEDLDDIKRRSLLSAYNYIFGGDKHPTVNYLKIINMIKGTYFGKRKNKLYFVQKDFTE